MGGYYFEVANAAPRGVKKNIAATEKSEAKFPNKYIFINSKWDDETFEACIKALCVGSKGMDSTALRLAVAKLALLADKATASSCNWSVRIGKAKMQLGFGYSKSGDLEEAMKNRIWL